MQPHYSHITSSDRMSIQALLAAKLSCRAIARQLSFHLSSVCREVSRAKTCATASAASYLAGRAQARSAARRTLAGAARRKLGTDVKTPLWRTVLSAPRPAKADRPPRGCRKVAEPHFLESGLRCHWSPEQIAGKPSSVTRTAPGSAAPTRTPMASSESSSRRAWI